MKKYKIVDSLGETLGFVVVNSIKEAQSFANKLYGIDNPKLKEIK